MDKIMVLLPSRRISHWYKRLCASEQNLFMSILSINAVLAVVGEVKVEAVSEDGLLAVSLDEIALRLRELMEGAVTEEILDEMDDDNSVKLALQLYDRVMKYALDAIASKFLVANVRITLLDADKGGLLYELSKEPD